MTPSPAPDPAASLRRACRDIADAPLARASPPELADRFLDGLTDLLGADRAGLMLLDESTFAFDLVRARPPDARMAIEAGVSALIESGAFAGTLRNTRPTVVDSPGSTPGPILLVPIATGAVTTGMGVVLLGDDGAPAPARLAALEALAVLLCSRLEGRGAWDRASSEIGEQRRIREEKDALNLDLERSIFRMHRLEQQRDDLTRMIVHDLRTPMTSVKTTLDMMTRGLFGKLTPRETDMARVAAESSDRLLGMVNDLLDISKFEAGEMSSSPRVTDVTPLLENVAASLSSLARLERKSIAFEGADGPVEVTTDPDLLRRIVENLAGNALRFSARDSRVTIALRRTGDAVEIAVRDEGEGIPPEYLDRIFEKFVQVESRLRGRKLGTGLGLTFCQYATRTLGGTIRVESEPGCGSTFTVHLPV